MSLAPMLPSAHMPETLPVHPGPPSGGAVSDLARLWEVARAQGNSEAAALIGATLVKLIRA